MAEARTHIAAGEGRALYVLGDRVVEKGSVPGSDLLIAELTVRPGSGTPLHTHPSPEVFLITAGPLTFTFRNHRLDADSGDVIVVPGGVWHGYVNNGRQPARAMILYDRSLARFFEAVGTHTPPSGPPGPESVAAVLAIARAMGMEIARS